MRGAKIVSGRWISGTATAQRRSSLATPRDLTQKERPDVVSAKLVALYGELSDEQFAAVKAYCINPVEAREASLDKPETLAIEAPVPADVAIIEGFGALDQAGLAALASEMGLAMSLADLTFCQSYFRDTEHRDPFVTEIRVIDTYWSDHCRHTTFFAAVDRVTIDPGEYTAPIAAAYEFY